jgi:hypothetical protein
MLVYQRVPSGDLTLCYGTIYWNITMQIIELNGSDWFVGGFGEYPDPATILATSGSTDSLK